MSNIFLEAKEADELTALIARVADLSDEELTRFTALTKANNKVKAERGDKIKAIKKQIGELKVSALDLFTPEDFDQSQAQSFILGLQDKFKFQGLEVGFAAAAAKGRTAKAPKAQKAPAAVRASDANPIVITIKPEGVGRSLTYHQGRVWETASDVVKKPWAKFPESLIKAVKEGKLETFADAEWAKTKEGKLELEAIKWAANNPDKKAEENPHKPKAAAPAAAAA